MNGCEKLLRRSMDRLVDPGITGELREAAVAALERSVREGFSEAAPLCDYVREALCDYCGGVHPLAECRARGVEGYVSYVKRRGRR